MVMTWARRRTETTDKMLLIAARAGDTDAIERLLLPHEPGLRALCRGMLVRPEDAEDALQETYLRALRGLDGFRGNSTLRTWLTRIAIRVCTDFQTARKTDVSLEQSSEDTVTPLSLTVASPERSVVRASLLDEALSVLSPVRRIAILLKAEGWTLEEIGNAQNWSVARTKVELFRARQALEKWAIKQAEIEGKEG
jgi:RNA polymerase sigma-70 factor, ECF subfamily